MYCCLYYKYTRESVAPVPTFLVSIGLWLIMAPGTVSGSGTAQYGDELNLRDALFNNYSNAIRPVKNQKDEVHVNFTFELLNIEGMNVKTQTLTITLFTIMKWRDENLIWDPASYGGAESFHVHSGDKKDVWKPDVSTFNTINQFVELGNNHNPLVIKSDGTVTMESGVVLSTHCDVDVTYYPFDTQVCDIIIGTFIYTIKEVNMTVHDIKMDNYRANQEWELIALIGEQKDMTFDTEPQAVLDFRLTIKRRKPFFMMYLILPLIMLGLLNPVVFLLPPDAGEKMSLSITTLLTYAVFLTVIGDHVPSTSQHIPVLAFYLFITFLISCVCVWLSVLMLKFFHKPEDEVVPRWIKNITCGGLARILCIERDCPKCNEKIERVKKANTISPEDAVESLAKGAEAVEEHQITWQGVVEVMDNFNFWLFFVISVIIALTVFIVLITFHE